MQLADLMRLFREGQNEGRKRGYVSQGACDAEGIAAVIRALRDEFGRIMYPGDDWNRQGILEQFEVILGDAGEKVAGDVYPDGARISGLENAAPAASGSPATDPAPAVCEWTVKGRSYTYTDVRTQCGDDVVLSLFATAGRIGTCGKCHAPIKFTEAK